MDLAHDLHPNVCLLDIDGLTLAAMLRVDTVTGDVLLIAMSGYGQEPDGNRTLSAGFDRYFVKPKDIDVLGAVLAEICSLLHKILDAHRPKLS